VKQINSVFRKPGEKHQRCALRKTFFYFDVERKTGNSQRTNQGFTHGERSESVPGA
jgi:hypothetical protein